MQDREATMTSSMGNASERNTPHPGPAEGSAPAGAGGLDIDFLQELCDLMAGELPDVTVSFMGAGGRILASSARERLGDVHHGAARIMRGETDAIETTADVAAGSSTMREGLCRLIEFEGKRIGCLALAAPLPV